MVSNTNTCKISALVLTAFREGMKIFYTIKDHLHSSINGFCERLTPVS